MIYILYLQKMVFIHHFQQLKKYSTLKKTDKKRSVYLIVSIAENGVCTQKQGQHVF